MIFKLYMNLILSLFVIPFIEYQKLLNTIIVGICINNDKIQTKLTKPLASFGYDGNINLFFA